MHGLAGCLTSSLRSEIAKCLMLPVGWKFHSHITCAIKTQCFVP